VPGKNILIADDEDHILLGLKFILKEKGYRVTPTNNGMEALRKILEFQRNNETVDLLLTDFRMPKLNGLELLDRLNDECLSVPVICMTGFGDKNLFYELKIRGCTEYLQKPFTMEEALKKVEKVLTRHKTLFEYGWIIHDMI